MDQQQKPDEPKIEYTLHKLGIKNYVRLGCGTRGCAYNVSGIVYKITNDESEYRAAKLLLNKKLVNVYKIYDTFECDDLYVIICEYLYDVLTPYRKFACDVIKKLRDKIGVKYATDISTYTLPKLNNAMINGLINGLRELYNANIRFNDIHYKNTLFSYNGAIKFIDIGYSSSYRAE